MSFYERRILPYLLNIFMDTKGTREERSRTLADVRGSVLEVGFGSGHNLPHYPAGVERVVGIDPSGESAKLARARIARASFPVEFLPLSGEQIPAPDGSFDSVVATVTAVGQDGLPYTALGQTSCPDPCAVVLTLVGSEFARSMLVMLRSDGVLAVFTVVAALLVGAAAITLRWSSVGVAVGFCVVLFALLLGHTCTPPGICSAGGERAAIGLWSVSEAICRPLSSAPFPRQKKRCRKGIEAAGGNFSH